MGLLRNLRELLLFHNQLSRLPYELGSLFQMHTLGLHGNPLQDPWLTYSREGTEAVMSNLLDNIPSKSTLHSSPCLAPCVNVALLCLAAAANACSLQPFATRTLAYCTGSWWSAVVPCAVSAAPPDRQWKNASAADAERLKRTKKSKFATVVFARAKPPVAWLEEEQGRMYAMPHARGRSARLSMTKRWRHRLAQRMPVQLAL